MSKIKLISTAKNSYKPDINIFKITYTTIKKTSLECQQAYNEYLLTLKEEFKNKFPSFKRVHFSILNSYKSGVNISKKIYEGLKLTTSFIYKDHIENQYKNTEEFSNSSLNLEIEVSYSLKDYDKYQNEVLKEAISKGKEKAEFIASTINKKVGEIEEIEYNNNSFYAPMSLCSRSSNVEDLEINNIEINQEVSLVFNLI